MNNHSNDLNKRSKKVNNIQNDANYSSETNKNSEKVNNIHKDDSNQIENNDKNIHSRTARNEKATKRMKKASKKKKKEEKIFNRTLKSNHWTNKAIRAAVILACLSLVVGAGSVIKKEVERYNNTSQWKKLQRVQMSDMEPFMLSLNDKDYLTANEIIELRAKIWNQQNQSFNPSANQSEIDQFNSLYDSFEIKNESLNQFKEKVVDTYWPIKLKQNQLVDGTEIKSDSFIDVIQYLNQSSEKLSVDAQDAQQDSFIKQTEEMNKKLASDLNNIQNFHQNMNSLLQNPGEKDLMLSPDATESSVEETFAVLDTLNYQWPELRKMNELKDQLKEFASINESKQSLMQTYQYDLQLQKAFKEYLQKYKEDIQYLNANKVELKDFVGMSKSDVEKWGSKNGIFVQFDEHYSQGKKEDEVIHQSILPKDYKYILKGSTIVFVINIDNSSTMKSTEEIITSTSSSKETTTTTSSSQTQQSSDQTEFSRVEEDTEPSTSYTFSSSESNRR